MKEFINKSWRQSWPVVMIMLFEFMIGLVDVFVAGRISKEVQAAYGFVSQMFFVLIIAGTAITVGTVSMVSKLFKSEDREEFNRTVSTSIRSSFIVGGILGLAGYFFSGPMIRHVSIDVTIKDIAANLLKTYSIGLMLRYFIINSNGILRSVEKVRSSMVTMAVVCLLNLPLNFLFVFKFGLGYRGIALATVTSALVGVFLNLRNIFSIKITLRDFSPGIFKQMIRIGWPIGVLQIAWQLGTTILFLVLNNLQFYHIESMAAFTNGLRIEAVIFLPAFAFNMANAVIVGNHLGEGSTKSAYTNGIVTAILGCLIITLESALVFIFAEDIAGILSSNDIVIRECVKYLRITLLLEPLMAVSVILGGGLNGAGDTRKVMKAVVLCVWLIRLPLAYLFVVILRWDAVSVWAAMNISVAVQALFIIKRYLSKKWIQPAIVDPVPADLMTVLRER